MAARLPGKEHWNLNFAECKPAWCCVVFKPRSKREQIFTNIVLKTTRGSSCWPYGPFGTLIWSVLAIETGCFAPSFFLFLNLLFPSALNHFCHSMKYSYKLWSVYPGIRQSGIGMAGPWVWLSQCRPFGVLVFKSYCAGMRQRVSMPFGLCPLARYILSVSCGQLACLCRIWRNCHSSDCSAMAGCLAVWPTEDAVAARCLYHTAWLWPGI